MEYKAVISDLDGTLLNNNHEVSDYTKEVIRKVLEKGVKFFIATGRHHKDAEYIRNNLGLDTTLITSNGSRVHDGKREELFAHDIDEKIVKEILLMDFDKEIHRNIYQGDQWFAERENPWVNEFHNESGFCYDMMDFNHLKSYRASKLFFVCDNHEKLQQFKEKIEQKFPHQLNMAFSLPLCLEVMPHGVSKGSALEKILKEHNIHPKEAVAFGDGFNDFEMLKLVGKGLVMGNAHEKLKTALPENEVIQRNDEDGVANYLKRIFL